MKKEFKPFDRIIIKQKIDCGIWFCALFSHYCQEDNNYFFTIGGDEEGYGLEDVDVLPFENHEDLVGTSDMPEEAVELKEGDIIVTFDNIRDIDMPFEVSINQFKHLNESSIHVCIKADETEFISYSNFCIPFSKFNPNDLEETKKHILCVKNGKLVRYRK